MEINISGQNIEITDALRSYVEERFSKISRHFDGIMKSSVILQVEKLRHQADAKILTKGSPIHANATAGSMYDAIDMLASRLNRQVLKYKDKGHNHHQAGGALKDQPLQ
ncbi:MAG TPA: ribosome-associated translation inhibitor RaiA [Gammaproteobacteria bacterium]|nr:ribosome-associated translation inhibitor RaiA [Gammaproteobacteria bacterium]